MSKRGDADLINDIKEAMNRIGLYTEKTDYEEFLRDPMIQDAVVRNLEIIGEAVKNLSSSLKEKYPRIAWKEMAGIRDRLIHHYFGVNYDIVWAIIKKELPGTAENIDRIIINKKNMGNK